LLRILHIIATLDRAGAEGQLTRLCLGLDRREFSPAVCCLTRGGPHEEALRRSGIPVAILHKRGPFDAPLLGRLVLHLKRRRPHIVQTWLPTANAWGRAAAVLTRVPVVIASERAADVWKGALRRWLDRRLARASDAVLTNADAVRRFCIERIRLPDEKMHVIRNGLDLREFDRQAGRPVREPVRRRSLLLGTVARLDPQKGVQYLLKAVSLLAFKGEDVELWIVGDGPERPRLEGMCRASTHLCDRVRLLGRREDVPALLRCLDIFVLPSLWEGLPNAVLEAMAAERPVVATGVDGTGEAVVAGETGLLVPPRSPQALAGAIRSLARHPARRARMGKAGRARVERHFSERRMIEETESLYRRLAREAGLV